MLPFYVEVSLGMCMHICVFLVTRWRNLGGPIYYWQSRFLCLWISLLLKVLGIYFVYF